MPSKKSGRRGRNEGSFRQLENGTWEGKVSLGIDETGKRIRRAFYGPTKTDVQAQVHEVLAAAGRAETVEDRRTVGEWLDDWLAQTKETVEPNTYVWYERRVRLHLKPRIGHIRLSRLSGLDVSDMLSRLEAGGTSRGERRNAMTTLRRAIKIAQRVGLVVENVAYKVDKPMKVRKKTEVFSLTLPQAHSFLAAARTHRLYALFVLFFDAGMRSGELFGLHWPEVDTVKCTVRVCQSLEEISGYVRLKPPKSTKGFRTLPVTTHTAEALAAHREKMRAEGHDVLSGPVFVNLRGGFLRQANFHQRVFAPLATKAELPDEATPYSIRHTAATQMLAAGVSLKVVSERLGHEDVETTLRHYAHVLAGMQEQAVWAVEKLFFTPPAE